VTESNDRASSSGTLSRCDWAVSDPLLQDYHDSEWGVPSHDDRHLFELLILEGAQAGLSWLTILKRREAYRRAFNNFDADQVAGFGPEKVQELIDDGHIIRNRAKIEATIQNARAMSRVAEEQGSFSEYVWSFVEGKPVQNARHSFGGIPAHTEVSARMSKDLRKRGFSFVGPTICYAFMQAAGLVNDHVTTCFRFPELSA
jgi:DNA-3-methyladenine glycosylase I